MSRVYPLGRILIASWYKLWLRNIEGYENLPKPPFIIASNHASYYEIMLYHCTISLRLNTKIHALVNGNYWNNTVFRWFLDTTQHIPVDVSKTPEANINNQKALEKADEYLKKGDIVLIFPEGHRSKDGKLLKGKTGIAKLALISKAPVVPIGVIGSEKILPRGSLLPRFKRCDVKIGKPIFFDKHYDKKITKKLLNEITSTIMGEIATLIGQKYDY
jgi:1-acyl-sn-glycerol-3-phosphate acyltransferase